MMVVMVARGRRCAARMVVLAGGVCFSPPVFGKMVAGVEENEGVTIFLYTFYDKIDISVEENRGVAVFLYSFAKRTARSAKT